MRQRWLLYLVVILILIVMYKGVHGVRAQTPTTPLALTVAGAHTSCLPAAASTTTFCFASDGLWQSLNGGAYTQVGATATAGVTSWNGLTGAVTYTAPVAPVTSVNGKTGAVVLGATTTLQ